MSIEAISWALRIPVGGNEKVMLLGIANHAHPDGSESYPTLDTLAEYGSCDRSTARRNVRKLIAAGWVLEDGLGPRGQAKYRLAMGVADCHPPQSATGGTGASEGVASEPVGGGTGATRTVLNRPRTERHDDAERAREAWPGVPDEMRRDADELLRRKRKVDGQLVTEQEMRIAAVALSEFNRQGESDFGLGANLTGVVMRVRERPSWDEGKHVRLVASAWRLRWWERIGRGGRPTPQVVYGNARCFEQVAQDAAAEAAGREIERSSGSGVLRTKTWPDGRSWDDLTPREQMHAREALAMGIEPWREDARISETWTPERAGGIADAGVTADTFLD